MKLVKSDCRKSLNEATLSDCLMRKLEGSSMDYFKLAAARNLWSEKTGRRPGSSKSAQNLQGFFF